jgi:YfiH family protein
VTRPASVRFTTTVDGDLAIGADPDALAARRQRIAPHPWTWLRQVHGAEVVVVTRPGEHAGAEADAAVTTVSGAVLAVQTADCVPLWLLGGGGEAPMTIGVVHAGWRGLAAGVIERTAAAMAAIGSPPSTVRCGPHIRARCYEFGAADLDEVVAACGEEVRGTTAWGTPALDLTTGVRAACERLGVRLMDEGTCTACSPVHFSHRARGDAGRQAVVAWIEP